MPASGTESRTEPGAVHPKLLELLEKDELDWENLRHREMYLKAWVAGRIPRFYQKEAAHDRSG